MGNIGAEAGLLKYKLNVFSQWLINKNSGFSLGSVFQESLGPS